jgi:hypothetical protein
MFKNVVFGILARAQSTISSGDKTIGQMPTLKYARVSRAYSLDAQKVGLQPEIQK